MIGQELILLGLLKESPKHGYEIKKEIKEILAIFAGIDLSSIYYPLRVLEKDGLVIKHKAKKGRRPERFVYKLTPRGEARFRKLLNDSFLNFKRPQFSLDLSLYFLNYIKPEVARRRLAARVFILKRLSKNLREQLKLPDTKDSPSLNRILRHNLEMVDAEASFLLNLTEAL